MFKKNEVDYLKIIGLVATITAPLIYKLSCKACSAFKNRNSDPLRPTEEKRFGENKDRDLVDEAIDQSFPASDPPAHAARLD